jgi:hypothetical protein
VKAREQPTISIRMPPDLRDWLELQRRRLGERSINGTVVVLLETIRKENTACG